MEPKRDKLNFFSTLKFINGYLDHLRVQLILFYLGFLVDTLIGIITPILLGIMIDQMVYYRNLPLFIRVAEVSFGLSVFSCISYYLLYELYSHVWNQMIYRFRCKMFGVVMKMDAEEMANSNYGDMAQMTQWKAMECVHFMIRNVIHNINNYIKIIVCLFVLYVIHPWIALVVIVMVPISVAVSWKFGKKIRQERARNQDAYGDYVGWLYEVFGALKDIRLLGAEHRVHTVFHRHQDALIQTDVRAGIAALKAQSVIANANVWLQMLLYVVLALLAAWQGFSIGSVVVVLTFFATLTRSLKQVSERYMDMQNRMAVIQRIKDLIERPASERQEKQAAIKVREGNVEFSELTFSYRGKDPVIRGFNLHIKHGEKVALVGGSGCGKTTLSYMLLGFYAPQKGKICIDGQDISEYSLCSLRENVGVVQQDVLIFDGSIRYNIMLGNPDAGEEQFIKACKAAGVYEFAMEYEEGFDTILGKKGRQLSGGQKQRVAIARTYLRNPAILIFDEATASLDNETEAMIHQAWKGMLTGRTAIVIAHRLSSVMLCDRVALMEGGRIVETGEPEMMKRSSQRFRSLFAIRE